MFCSNCGKKVEGDIKYCSNCGAMVQNKPNPQNSIKSNPTNTANNLKSQATPKPAKKKTGMIVAIVIIVLLVPIMLLFAGITITSLSENWAPIETFPSVETSEFTFSGSNDFNITKQDDYTFNNKVDDTETQVNNGTSRIKEFNFSDEYCDNTYMYTYAEGAYANLSDGDIVSLSGSALFDKSMNDNPAVPGYVDGYVEGLKLIESINSEDVTVNITDNGDYISLSFTFSNLSGNANSEYVKAVATWFGVTVKDDAIKDADLSACLENSRYTVKEY